MFKQPIDVEEVHGTCTLIAEAVRHMQDDVWAWEVGVYIDVDDKVGGVFDEITRFTGDVDGAPFLSAEEALEFAAREIDGDNA